MAARHIAQLAEVDLKDLQFAGLQGLPLVRCQSLSKITLLRRLG
ncbi:MAG: hypothetical protein RBJ76_14035 [Stenomitos frigidus ULC029]